MNTSEFIETWFKDAKGFLELRAIGLEKNSKVDRLFSSDIQQINQWISCRENRQNLYIGVATRKVGATSGKKSDCYEIFGFHCDVDFKDFDEGEKGALEKIETFPFEPSITVSSGNGYHLYWRFYEPQILNTDNIYIFENTMRGIAEFLNGDNCWDISRVFRMAGTTNIPTKKKIDLGMTKRKLCFVKKVSNKRYKPEDFEQFMVVQSDSPVSSVETKSISPDLPKKFQGDLKRHKYLDDIWSGVKATLKKGSTEFDRSRMDSSLTHSLVSLGYSDEDIASILYKFKYGKANERRDPKEYIVSLIANAKSHILTDKTDVDIDWETPIEIGAYTAPDPLGVDHMPPQIFEIVNEVSEWIQVPIELAFSCALPIISVASGNKFILRFPKHTDYCTLWFGTALPSGCGKSPVWDVLTNVVVQLEKELKDSYTTDLVNWKTDLGFKQALAGQIKSKVKNQYSDDAMEYKNLLTEIAELEENPPVKKKIWVQDTTPSSLLDALAENSAVAVLSAEAGPIFQSFGMFSKSSQYDLGNWLSAYSGETIKSDRRSSKSVHVITPLLNVGVSFQPLVLEDFFHSQIYKGLGFEARFIFFVPNDPTGYQNYDVNKVLREEVIKRWDARIKHIYKLDLNVEFIQIGFDSDAIKILLDKWKEIEVQKRAGGILRFCKNWANKLKGAIARLALAYHVFVEDEPHKKKISKENTQYAINACEKFIEHRLSIETGAVLTEYHEKAALILQQIRAKQLTEVSVRQIAHQKWASLKYADDVRKVCKILEDLFHLKGNQPTKPTKYLVNPMTLSVKSGESTEIKSEGACHE